MNVMPANTHNFFANTNFLDLPNSLKILLYRFFPKKKKKKNNNFPNYAPRDIHPSEQQKTTPGRLRYTGDYTTKPQLYRGLDIKPL